MRTSTLHSMSRTFAPERAQAAFRPPAGCHNLAVRRGCSTVCMAHPRRVAKVAKQIEREVGNLLITDKVLQQAVCPERRRGFDGALSALASVTEVQISNDLQVAKVYMSIYSDDVGKAAAMEGLQRLEGYVRKHIGRAIRLRLTPEIRFVRDDSIERTERIFKLLDQVKKIERGEAEPPPLAIPSGYEFVNAYGYGDDEEEADAVPFEAVDLGMFGDEPVPPAATASSSGRGAAAGARQGQQPPQQPGGGRQQQRRRQGQDEEDAGKAGLQGDDEDMEDMLAAFRQQVQQRQFGGGGQ